MELRAAAERISRAHDENADTLSLSGAFIVQLADLPELTALTSLTRLDLSYNVVAELPDSLSLLRALTSLSVSHNSLALLPVSLSSLVSLHSLELSFNRITSVPDIIFSSLTSLRSINLQRNRLTAVPSTVSCLVHLESLNIASNNLERLPPEIGRCTALLQLAISGNSLRTLPFEIAQLTRLERLYASQNKVALLPDACLTSLRALQELDLRDNALHLLPSSLSTLPLLKKLVIAGNERLGAPSSTPIDDVPALLFAVKSITDKNRTALVIAGAARVFPEVEPSFVSQMANKYGLASTDEFMRALQQHVASLPPAPPVIGPSVADRLIANYSPPPPAYAAEPPLRTRRGTLTNAVDVEDLARNRLVSALQTEVQFHSLLQHALSARAYLAAPPALMVCVDWGGGGR